MACKFKCKTDIGQYIITVGSEDFAVNPVNIIFTGIDVYVTSEEEKQSRITKSIA